jgi:hypothetical protein
MYIALVNRPDRMGANLTWYIMQIIYAHHHKYFIHCYHLEFNDSIFIKTVREYVDKYNIDLAESFGSYDHGQPHYWVQINQQDWPGNNMLVCKDIGVDLVTYFKRHLYIGFRDILEKQASRIWVNARQMSNKIISVHLRLDDVSGREDYDGSICAEYYREKLNSGNIEINLAEEHAFGNTKGVYIPSWGRTYNKYDCQAPIAEERVQRVIDQAREKYPDHEVIIVASPKGDIHLPYPCVRSDNIDEDLYYLCNSDVLICSRSLYCFASVYLGNAKEIYLPLWGHIVGTGLTTKYDEAKINYYV